MEWVLNADFLKILSSTVGMIGGFLGFFAFIDNYMLRFKPKLNISNKIFFCYEDDEKNHFAARRRSLESVILKVEAINGRNKIGRIDDFAIRVYNSSATFPNEYMLYAENILDQLPSNSFSFKDIGLGSFSPVSILKSSTRNIVLEFRPEKYMGVIIDPEGSLRLDLIFYLPKKGWKVAGSFMPFYFKGHNEKEDPSGIIEYTLLDNSVTRKAAADSLKPPKAALYKGISGKYLGFYSMKPFRVMRNVITYPIKVLKLVVDLVMVLFVQAVSCYVVLPLINFKSKALPRLQFRPARAHLIKNTETALQKCRSNIEIISEKINSKADSDARVIVRDESSGFIIQRGRLEVKFYISGDGYIQADDTGGYPKMFTFSMELVEYPFGFSLWKVNNKVMTIRSACIHVMDSFILLAH